MNIQRLVLTSLFYLGESNVGKCECIVANSCIKA